MNEEQQFRLAIVGLGVLFVPIALYHRVRSNSTGEKLDRWQEGVFILFALRTAAGIGFLGLLGFLVHPPLVAWASVPLPTWLRWTGVGAGLLGGSLMAWAFHTLGRNLTDTVVTREQHTLVTSGPYRWVRHPFYVAVVLCFVACSLLAANWLIAAGSGTALLLLMLRTPD